MQDHNAPVSAWARLKIEGPFPLRRGAWYWVSEATEIVMALDVHGQTIVLPTAVLDVVHRQPDRWTVVPRPENATLLPPPSWGDHYGVCPSCAHRAPLFGAPAKVGCRHCGLSFAVAWDEGYLGRLAVRPGL